MVILMATPGGAEQSNPSSQIIFLLLIVGVFYFFMIRPQMKKQKELKNFRKELKKGDKVVTTGGIYGKINDVKENIITMEISPNVHNFLALYDPPNPGAPSSIIYKPLSSAICRNSL